MIDYTGYTFLLPDSLYPFYQFYSSFLHFDALAIGCMAAILYVNYNKEMLRILSKFGGASAMLAAALILVPYILIRLHPNELFIKMTGYTLQAVGFAMLILQSILFPQFFKPLNWAIVRHIGVLSYSIYIWQMLFCSDPQSFGLSHVWFMSFYGWLVPVFLVAIVSYYCFERPLMALRAKFRK
jgi:peptidoglycan/LPS O-acetylase OafA/YrhL